MLRHPTVISIVVHHPKAVLTYSNSSAITICSASTNSCLTSNQNETPASLPRKGEQDAWSRMAGRSTTPCYVCRYSGRRWRCSWASLLLVARFSSLKTLHPIPAGTLAMTRALHAMRVFTEHSQVPRTLTRAGQPQKTWCQVNSATKSLTSNTASIPNPEKYG